MKFGVLVFPGSNCDHDTYNVIAEIAHQPVTFLWHDSEDLAGVDAVLVPGGFAYGDYLRTGAIARFSPVMQAVKRFANDGGMIPEQIWDWAQPTQSNFVFGQGTGSATPLAWSMAQYIRLVVDSEEHRIVEQPAIVADHFAKK